MIKERTCIACKTKKQKSEMYRIVCNNSIPYLDEKYNISSRAIYICKDEKCIKNVIKSIEKGRINLKVNVNYSNLKELLEKIIAIDAKDKNI